MWPGLESPTELNAAAEGGRSGYIHRHRAAGGARPGRRQRHLAYHFVRTQSLWEWARLAHSESVETPAEGLQEGLWVLAAVPWEPRTGRLRRPRRTD